MEVQRSNRTVGEWEALVGDQVRRVRIAKDVDQAGLAELADISVGAVSNLERGKGSSLRTLIAVLRALGQTEWLSRWPPRSPCHRCSCSGPSRRRLGPGCVPAVRGGRNPPADGVPAGRRHRGAVLGRAGGGTGARRRVGFYAFEYDARWARSGVELAPVAMPAAGAAAPFVFPALPGHRSRGCRPCWPTPFRTTLATP